jgi:IS30 family transposase
MAEDPYPDDESMRVSHQTIYRTLFMQARGVLKKEPMDHLRSKQRMRRSRHASDHGQSRGRIVDASRSGKGPRKWKTGRFLGMGKAIYSAVQNTVILPPRWSAIRGLSY